MHVLRQTRPLIKWNPGGGGINADICTINFERNREFKRREKQRAAEAKKAEKAAAKAALPQAEKKEKKDTGADEEELDSNVS